jgi:hypothetical protein
LAAFYLLSLLLAKFSITYQNFFYWPAFNVAILLLTIIYFITLVYFNWKKVVVIKIPKLKIKSGKLKFKFINFKLILKNIFLWLNKIFGELKKNISQHWPTNPRWFFARVAIIFIIMILALWHGIILPDFLTLAYALIAFLFMVDNRYAAGLALLFLAACPVLLICKNDGLAEFFAVYAYYFLVITVVSAIIEMKLKKS